MKTILSTKQLTRLICSILTISLFFTTIITTTNISTTYAATGGSMDIHALYLDKVSPGASDIDDEAGTAGGDSVLISSAGEYILMDTGFQNTYASYLKPYLDKVVGKGGKLNLYLSHYHKDHYDAIFKVAEDYDIQKIYLPDYTKIATQLLSGNTSIYNSIVDTVEKKNAGFNAGTDVVLLSKGKTFSVGDADFKVLGPSATIKKNGVPITPNSFKNDSAGNKEGHYTNNYSLVTKVVCGSTSYLSTGDIEKEAEADMLSNSSIKSQLKSDILKLGHHGVLATSNTVNFLAAVKPTYSFAMTSGDTTLIKNSDSSSDKRKYMKTHGVRNRVTEYGFCYITGDQNKNLRLSTSNSKVTMYESGKAKASETKLTKWVSPKGGHGQFSSSAKRITVDKYYIDPTTGKPLKGVQKINGKSYYLGKGGRLEYGYYDSKSKYNGWRNLNGGQMYISSSGVMNTGFYKIGSHTYYFKPSTGTKKLGTKSWKVYQIGKKKYGLNQNGVVFMKGWKSYKIKGKKNNRYFSKKTGAMKTGFIKTSGRLYYLKKSDGLRVLGNKKWKIKKIGKKKYAINENGVINTSGWKSYKVNGSTKYRYFNKKTGVMQTGKKKIGGKTYKFNKKGYCKNR